MRGEATNEVGVECKTFETNKISSNQDLDGLRRRLGEGDGNVLNYLAKRAQQQVENARSGTEPTYVVEDGTYQVETATDDRPDMEEDFTAEIASDSDDSFETRKPQGDQIVFSYPSSFHAETEVAGIVGIGDDSTASDLMISGNVEPRGAAGLERTTAWGSGMSRTVAADGDIAGGVGISGTSPRPNVIVPEPNELALMGIFGSALLAFSRRRSTTGKGN